MKKKTNNQINNNNKKVGRPIFAPPPSTQIKMYDYVTFL